ncbi:MAG: energy transducer TonB [Woeseiaceae bacterium]
MLARALQAGAFAFVVTTGLLWVMQFLISAEAAAPSAPREHGELNWVLPPRHDDPPMTDFERPDIPPPPVPPPTPVNTPRESSEPGFMPPTQPPPPGPYENQGPSSVLNDGPLVVMVRVQPSYPVSMSARGVEGHVIVEFDVSAAGTVTNLRVVASSHKGFERSALNAAERFRYKPRVIDGEAQTTYGVRAILRFEMEK